MTPDAHDPSTEMLPSHSTDLITRDSCGNGEIVSIPHQATRSRWKVPRWSVIAAVGSVLLLLAAGMWHWWSSDASSVQYKIALVERGPITSIVTATGTVNPVVSVQVGSQVSGKIAKLFADFNSVVEEGQVLAQIDQQPFKARVRQARAAVRSAQGNLHKAKNMASQRKRERDRMATLRLQAFVSQADLDMAETTHRDAAAHVHISELNS